MIIVSLLRSYLVEELRWYCVVYMGPSLVCVFNGYIYIYINIVFLKKTVV